MDGTENSWTLDWTRLPDGGLTMRCGGRWLLEARLPSVAACTAALADPASIPRVVLDATAVTAWDTGFVSVLNGLSRYCGEHDIVVDASLVPEGARRLLELALAVPERQSPHQADTPFKAFAQLGNVTLELLRGAPQMLRFVGEVTVAMGAWARGRAQVRGSDVLLFIQECGPQALPIVSLISFLVGLILAYMGALQLRPFGAQVYVADLVGLGMVREMGAMMVGMIIAGRTGAAFAAQIGTMQVNEEIDALRTLGISPIEFLVLPRILALVLMVPLLTLYANLVGMIGGLVIGVTTLDLNLFEYYQETVQALDLDHVVVGLIKATTFGALIAMAGCLRGMQCGRSAAAVGAATTSAVVTSIVLMVVASSILTIVFYHLGI